MFLRCGQDFCRDFGPWAKEWFQDWYRQQSDGTKAR